MGGPKGNANQAFSGGLDTGNQARSQNTGLFSTLFGTPGGNASGGAGGTGTLSKMLDPNSLNVSSPTGPYALQYQQAKANNAIGADQASQQINRSLGQHGFGAGAPSGLGEFLQSQNTQAANTNNGNLFSQFAGKSYQDALDNFWKATNLASGTSGDAQKTAANTYTNLYGTAQKAVTDARGQTLGLVGKLAGDAADAAGGKVGRKA